MSRAAPRKASLRARVKAAVAALMGHEAKRAVSYHGADASRLFSDWTASLRSADSEIMRDARKLLARARDLSKNNGYAKHYATMVVTNVLGPHGMVFQSKLRNAEGALASELNRRMEGDFGAWARGRVTVDGRLTLRQFQRLALRTVVRDGEAFVRKIVSTERNTFGLSLQLIDVALVDHTYNAAATTRTNEIRMGVEVDRDGRTIGIWVWTAYEAESSNTGRGRTRYFVPASELIHIYDPDYASQTRGYTWMHAGMASVQVLDKYEEAELFAARSAACKPGWFESTDNSETGAAFSSITSADPNTPQLPQEMEIEPGIATQLPVGWKYNQADPQHPVGAFEPFVKTVMRKIATAWSVAYNSLANNLEGVNYSSMRSGLLIERDVWRTLQQWWIDSFLTPLFEAWVATYLLTPRADGLPTFDAAYYVAGVEWQPRGWDWVDPKKEGEANVLAIDNCLDSHIRICSERGLDFERIVEEKAEAKRIAALHGVDLKDVTDAINAALPNAGDGGDEDDEEDDDTPPASGNGARNRVRYAITR